MNASRDPFGFPVKDQLRSTTPVGTNPIVVVAQPGQEVRIIVPDSGSSGPGRILGAGDSGPSGRVSPSGGSGDSGPSGRVSPSGGSGDSAPSGRVSPSGGSGDSGPSGRVSPSGGGGDSRARDPFGFTPVQRGFSPTPITVIAKSGQEIRVVVPDESGSIPGMARGPSGNGS